jgi:hypothetical protein
MWRPGVTQGRQRRGQPRFPVLEKARQERRLSEALSNCVNPVAAIFELAPVSLDTTLSTGTEKE